MKLPKKMNSKIKFTESEIKFTAAEKELIFREMGSWLNSARLFKFGRLSCEGHCGSSLACIKDEIACKGECAYLPSEQFDDDGFEGESALQQGIMRKIIESGRVE